MISFKIKQPCVGIYTLIWLISQINGTNVIFQVCLPWWERFWRTLSPCHWVSKWSSCCPQQTSCNILPYSVFRRLHRDQTDFGEPQPSGSVSSTHHSSFAAVEWDLWTLAGLASCCCGPDIWLGSSHTHWTLNETSGLVYLCLHACVMGQLIHALCL